MRLGCYRVLFGRGGFRLGFRPARPLRQGWWSVKVISLRCGLSQESASFQPMPRASRQCHSRRSLAQIVSLDRNSGPVDQVLSTATANRSRRSLHAAANDAALTICSLWIRTNLIADRRFQDDLHSRPTSYRHWLREPARSISVQSSHTFFDSAINLPILKRSWSLSKPPARRGRCDYVFCGTVTLGRGKIRAMESGVDFIACDIPYAHRITIHTLAAVAEDEARWIACSREMFLAGYRWATGISLCHFQRGWRIQAKASLVSIPCVAWALNCARRALMNSNSAVIGS